MQFLRLFTHMDGPLFLALYATLLVAFFVICMLIRHQIDRDDSGKPVVPDVDPDPYQMAYLRGGANEVCRLATFELLALGALEEKKSLLGSTKMMLVPEKMNAEFISLFAREASTFYREPRKPTEIFQSDIANRFTSKFREWDEWIDKQSLRISPEKQFKLNGIAVILSAIFAATGVFKITAAVLNDKYNVGYALFMIMAGTGAILLTRKPRRFSSRGRDYLRATQILNGQHRRLPDPLNTPIVPAEVSTGALGGLGSVPVMAMGLFGVAALQGSSYEGFRKAYSRSEASGGGCGASCAGASWSSGCGSAHHSTHADGSSCGASGASCGGGGGAGCGGGGCGGGCGGCGG